MNELQRQASLKALGLTPWVATEPMPGAAPTPVLDWPEQAESAALKHTPVAATPVSAAPEQQIPAVARAATAALEQTPVEMPSAHTEPVAETRSDAVAATPMTLQAHQVGDLWVLVEQEDPSAPDLGRDAQQLLQNLLAVFAGQRRGVRKFVWPLSDVTLDDSALRKTFHSFARGLGGRLLLCISDDTCQKLLAQPRYQIIAEPVPMLVVSALSEMLAEPATHKRASWQAMLAAGLHG